MKQQQKKLFNSFCWNPVSKSIKPTPAQLHSGQETAISYTHFFINARATYSISSFPHQLTRGHFVIL